MVRKKSQRSLRLLSYAISAWLALPAYTAWADDGTQGGGKVSTADIHVEVDIAQEEAKMESQQKTIITKEDIEKKQAKSVEDIIFSETGVSRTVDAMGRVGVSIRGAEPRHTLILVDGQPVMGDFAKYYGAADEVMRIGTENVERIEIIQGAASAKYGSDAIGGVVNIITKKAENAPSFSFNLEGRRIKQDDAVFPYQNVFMRADSGAMGKVRLGLYGSKRDIMPVYGSESRVKTGFSTYVTDFEDNSLRYYGEATNMGLIGSYEADSRNKFDFRLERYTEDLNRYVKRTDSIMEPQQHYSRKSGRNTYTVGWTGRNKDTDWKIELNHTRMREDDLTLTSNYGRSSYTGKNMLNYVDDIDHAQTNMDATFNTQLDDKHLLMYNFGYAREHGSGSRLKSAPKTYLRKIDPWDYDKSLLVIPTDSKQAAALGLKKGDVASFIHAHQLIPDAERGLRWDTDYERYGYNSADPNAYNPGDKDHGFSYEDYVKYLKDKSNYSAFTDMQNNAPDVYRRYLEFNEKVIEEAQRNNKPAFYNREWTGRFYYEDPNKAYNYTLNGKQFDEVRNSLKNQIIVGEATINKYHVVVGDTWMLNNDTIFTPILRMDHSSLFGTNITANFGITHNLKHNPSRRFKANIGTGYTEPGMGELYYNWEMYGGNPVDQNRARMGWYWVGNPNLKPEKSVNIDLGYEAETKKTTMRFNLFHNRIRNYMSTYYTGYNIDFHPDVKNAEKLGYPPDMIYSFKNIGKAEVTGLEAEVKHQFTKHWGGKLGYTYLYAVNKSDPNMPKRLLDKPRHKVDIGIDYENKAGGVRVSLWGDYYINMLDSNSVTGNANYLNIDSDLNGGYIFENKYARPGAQRYQKKTFGIWNIMFQKKINPDAMVYLGVDNLFDHRDDDRALSERVYRMGVNLKFGPDSNTASDPAAKAAHAAALNALTTEDFKVTPEDRLFSKNAHPFLEAPFDVKKAVGIDLIGDYRMAWDVHDGENRPQVKLTEDASIGTAEKNLLDKKDHGFSQRLRVGFDARVNKNLNISALASATGVPGVETKTDIPKSRGMNRLRVGRLDVTQHMGNFDVSLGRLRERMGVTGYYFGQEYDGIRAVYTGVNTQVRIGYGSFKRSTGITDSAYTHATHKVFYRPPTVSEFIGLTITDPNLGFDDPPAIAGEGENINFYKQLMDAKNGTREEQMAILKRMYDIVTKAYGQNLLRKGGTYDEESDVHLPLQIPEYKVKYRDSNGVEQTKTIKDFDFNGGLANREEQWIAPWDDDATKRRKEEYNARLPEINKKLEALRNTLRPSFADNPSMLEGDGSAFMNNWWAKNKDAALEALRESAKNILADEDADNTFLGFETPEDDIRSKLFQENFVKSSGEEAIRGVRWNDPKGFSKAINYAFNGIGKRLAWSEYVSLLPRDALGKYTGYVIRAEGTVLETDRIPAIERAFFVQAKHAVTKNFGIAAWYLGSTGDKTHSYEYANGNTNDVYSYDNLAHIIGVGAKWSIGKNAAVSFDYGQNRTAFGRRMNGHTIYDHVANTDQFKINGHAQGGTPHFWTLRFDVGQSDTDVPGSWNAFLDYKYFQHGSFFGGNGTGYLPDRYLDGIRSFSFGAGYVPVKNLLVELFYTFDAKGINTRDTLYGSEHFSLGNYASMRLTYRF